MSKVYRNPVSDDHRERLLKFHTDNPSIDKIPGWMIPLVNNFLSKSDDTEFLDYGCGNGYLGKAISTHTTHEYDPGFKDKAKEPEPCNLVTCINVLEYCEPDWFKQTLWHLQTTVKSRGFICIGLKEKDSYYEDGLIRTANIMPEWKWRQWIAQFFTVDSAMLIKDNQEDTEHSNIIFEVSPLDFTVITMAPFALR